ncbi:GNAT family N-acetyltransferase [Streptococcus ruminantium]|uniref:GNAT family N-acetyltransferase n=1 Tax=Streptococcus ruminantium TaxID=1917441 RepID=UPI0012DC4064|nr:GNAT family N-acetyltransferase [Streptococcus ruminantium]
MIKPVTKEDVCVWSSFASQVWQKKEISLLEQFRVGAFPNEFLYYDGEKKAIAWVSLSLRSEYVEGCCSSPVAYLEGIWVHPDYRQRGIAGQLLIFAEKWARTMGASQLASDADIDNVISQAFHIKNGFKEVSRTVHYVRNLVVDKE